MSKRAQHRFKRSRCHSNNNGSGVTKSPQVSLRGLRLVLWFVASLGKFVKRLDLIFRRNAKNGSSAYSHDLRRLSFVVVHYEVSTTNIARKFKPRITRINCSTIDQLYNHTGYAVTNCLRSINTRSPQR